MPTDRERYDEAEWSASVGHGPLEASAPGEAFLIYRHWIWANLQRLAFEQSFAGKEVFDPAEMVMVGRGPAFMFMWYGMLWSVVEALQERRIDIRGPLRDDIARMQDALRRCRNAIMHIPRDNSLLDARIEELIAQPEPVVRIRRIHHGLGRLLREEVQRQAAATASIASPPAES